MSIIALLCLLFAVAALLLLVLFFLQRRQLSALEEVSRQVQRTAIGGSLKSRIELQTDQPELAALVTAVNHLLARAAVAADQILPSSAPIGALGDRVHEAVLIHGRSIRYANKQFATLVGGPAEELLGRKLADLVPPEYTDLVADNMRRRLLGEAAAERYEIELTSLQGQTSRLELSTWPIDHEGEQALLIVGVEVLPTQTVEALQPAERRSRARLALESLPEALITIDHDGKIEHLNPAAARLLGTDAASASGKTLDAVARAVEESERKLLSEPVRQALSVGTPLNLGPRAVLIHGANGERLIELSAAPIRMETGESLGAVVLLHDVTEVRGLARQMSYQATHDALTGLVNRRDFERRVQDAIESGAPWRKPARAVLSRSGPLQGHQRHAAAIRPAMRCCAKRPRCCATRCAIPTQWRASAAMSSACCWSAARWRRRGRSPTMSIARSRISALSGRTKSSTLVSASAWSRSRAMSGSIEELWRPPIRPAMSPSARAATLLSTRLGMRCSRARPARSSGCRRCRRRCATAASSSTASPSSRPLPPMTRVPPWKCSCGCVTSAGEELPPLEFVRAAERYRLMGLVDRWVVQTTLTALGRGGIALTPKRSVAINISGQTLADGQFLEFVVDCFDCTGANPSQVCFEIAETAVVANLEQARRFVGVLHGMGCRFALDDFGSGLGSFANLKNLAVDYLKIDGSFFKQPGARLGQSGHGDRDDPAGPHTEFQGHCRAGRGCQHARCSTPMGVDYMQGYAVGRPRGCRMAA